MSGILTSLLEILGALILFRVIYQLGVPKRIRVLIDKAGSDFMNILFSFISIIFGTIGYLFRVIKSILSSDSKEEVQEIVAVPEIAATTIAVAPAKEMSIEEEDNIMDEYMLSMEDTYNFIVETYDSLNPKNINNSNSKIKKS